MCSNRSRLVQVVNDFAYDGLTQTTPLVFRFYRDIYHLIKETIVADHSPHPNHFVLFQN